MYGVRVERLDHLGIVAGVCREIGVAEYLDGLAGPTQQQVSIGTATVAMVLNGLGFSNRRLYLVSQFLRPSRSATCWGQASSLRCSMTTAWGGHWIGYMTMTRRPCSGALHARRGSALGSQRVSCTWIRPRSQ